MSWNGPHVVLAIIAIVVFGRVMRTSIRARYGLAAQDDGCGARRRDDLGADRKTELLADENARLKGQVSRLEERIAVLERIATDRPSQLARDIDALR